MAKVCIVGAGPSGLVAARQILQKLGTSTSITIFDAQPRIGGLWPLSPDDAAGQVHPLMVANQSRHTVHFSDLAWDADAPHLPRAFQVGRYLERYAERHLEGKVEWRLGTRVVRARRSENGSGWDVTARRESDGEVDQGTFGYLVVASGFFGRPVVDEAFVAGAEVPVVHSSRYRSLKHLFGGSVPKGKILVVGGQMSGVEISGTIAAHISSARHSPEAPAVNADELTVHHLVQRPVWVFPLHTSPKASLKAPPFAPLDMPSYNLSNRPAPLSNTQGHIREDAARMFHGIYEGVVGSDQSEFSPSLGFTDDDVKSKQPFMAVSDHYLNLVREGVISVQNGKLEAMSGTSATLADGTTVEVAAVVLATGFDASPYVDFLPDDVLKTLNHDPNHRDMPLALAFHGTHHPDVPGLGFVGFYRSPYWGIMEMQARFVATLWSKGVDALRATADDDSVKRTLTLRNDPRCSQFPMGDYIYIMSQFSDALSLPRSEPITDPVLPVLLHNNLPIDMLTPSRYGDATPDSTSSLQNTHHTIHAALTTPKFVARAIFRSLLGPWKLDRRFSSRLPSHPSGTFTGTATFHLRDPTRESRQCVSDPEAFVPSTWTEEYLYIETGTFCADSGLEFQATRRYVWRYDEARDVASVWFVKPDDTKRVDYLFHELDIAAPDDPATKGWKASAGHLCVEDYYNVAYEFDFKAVNLERWTVRYGVKGPAKDYTIRGEYRR